MNGRTAGDWAKSINNPKITKTINMGIIHQSLFSQRKQDKSLIMANLDMKPLIKLGVFKVLIFPS